MRTGNEIILDDAADDQADVFLDLRNLKHLVRHGEGQRLEFKMKVKFPEKIIKELVAFANSDGGHLFVGVSDDGQIEGSKFVDEDQFLLEKAISAYCFPAFTYHVYRIPLENGRAVLVYHVFESVDKPHFVQLESDLHPVCYVRVKDRTIKASKEMKQILRRENEEGLSFAYGDSERWLMEYLRTNELITLSEFATKANLPIWLASRKLVLLVLSRVLKIEAGEQQDIYSLR
ncbi:AlbA family DNA-binding domain-containing protein [Aquirufa sp. 5-AUSEE-100C1]